ncbi:MAG: glutamate--tRNA ligase [Planctomycetota bacterium]|nr:glutamate--tRNA ligase [Planctomycetota bacterium]MDP6762038.1 glutamate--tRNA ligase [Planctomycetota bacterium]MDP6989221.1 glutamate--tRNA ligase [Planctomycetota bacterium]
MTRPVRLRIAPSPTGAIHLGLARTALFNWAVARRCGGRFVLRIEDTDRERSTAESEAAILEGLSWLGLDWDEGPDLGGPHGPYRQSERIDSHREAAGRLLEAGSAYRCFCTTERLAKLRAGQDARKQTPAYDRRCRDLDPAEAAVRAEDGEPFALRFAVPPGETRVDDLVRGEVVFQNAEVDDWIMVRRDGNPTYNFVVVCDDVAMEISHVVRGEEHLVNTPKQVQLYEALGSEPPRFAHLPLMLGRDKKKLSKRSGDVSLGDYRAKGYPRGAILNFLALQGWALDGETEVFSLERFVEAFRLEDVSKGGAVFDPDKFRWLAGEYLRAEPVGDLVRHCAPFVAGAGQLDPTSQRERAEWLAAVAAGEQERISLYSELPERIAYLFAADDAVVWEPKAEKNARKQGGAVLAEYLDWLRPRLSKGVDAAILRDDTRAWIEERDVGFAALFQPLRCALSGKAGGPDLFDVMEWLGAEACLRRLASGVERLAVVREGER